MNKTMIRIISALLVLLMAVACFAACSDPVDPNEGEQGTEAPAGDGTQGGDGETEAPEQTIEDILGFEIPALNRQFNVLHQTQASVVTDIIADSFDGDEVTVAIYERNLATEEAFKTTMNYVGSFSNWSGRSTDKKFLEAAVQAGTNDYDMVVGSSVAMATMMYSGLFHNLCDVEAIDFDHSWWMADTVETYGIGGDHVYGAMGDITFSYYSNLGLIAANMTLVNNFGVEATHGNLYDLVYNGKWTLDKMLEIGAAYGEDNGDGIMTLGDDVFGLGTSGVPSRLFLFSLGHELITLNDTADGVVIPEAVDERTIASYEKLYAAFPKGGTGSSPNYVYDANIAPLNVAFSEDKLLMYTSYFSYLGTEEVRNMVSEYMIMPMPKYDEMQEDYVTPFATGVSMVLIPVTAVEAEESAMVMEYMGYQGQQDITPVYIEQTLKLKYASDPQVMDMVQYIIDRSAFTLTQALIWNCESGYFRNVYCFGDLNCVGSPNIASYYKTYRRVWQKNLNDLCADLQ